MKWLKNLFASLNIVDESENKQEDNLEEVLYQKRKRNVTRQYNKENTKKRPKSMERENFIEVKERRVLNSKILDTLQESGIEIEQEQFTKVRQLSQRSQKIANEVEQLGETVYKKHRSTRERSKISVDNLEESIKKVSPSMYQADDIFGVFPKEQNSEDIIGDIDEQYLETLVDDVPPLKEKIESEVESTYAKLTKPRKSFMEEYGPKSDEEVPYRPTYKQKIPNLLNTQVQQTKYTQLHKPSFKPATHFSAIHGTKEKKKEKVDYTTQSLNSAEYSSTGRILKNISTETKSKINGVPEPKTIAGLKRVEVKPAKSSRTPTSAISVPSSNKLSTKETQPVSQIEHSTVQTTRPYNVMSSVEERAKLRKLKKLGRQVK